MFGTQYAHAKMFIMCICKHQAGMHFVTPYSIRNGSHLFDIRWIWPSYGIQRLYTFHRVCVYMMMVRWWEKKTVATGAYFGLHLIAWASSNIIKYWIGVICKMCSMCAEFPIWHVHFYPVSNWKCFANRYMNNKGGKIALKHLMWHFDCFVDTVFINVSYEREVIENTFFLFLSNIRGKYNEK